MSLWLAVVLQVAPAAADAGGFDLASIGRTTEPVSASTRRCEDVTSADDVVVCARRRDRYRLPLPNERPALPERAIGESPGGMAALTPPGRCGIFAGERRCGKREASEYGYGNGRDPVTVLTRLATTIADPDAD